MARHAEIDYLAAKSACQVIAASGKTVTLTGLRNHLGKGSFPVLKRYLEQWNREAGLDNQYPGLPQELQEGLRIWLAKARDNADQTAAAKFEQDYEDFRAELAEVSGYLLNEKLVNEQLLNQVAELSHQMSLASLQIKHLEERLAESQHVNAEAMAKISVAEAEKNQALEQLILARQARETDAQIHLEALKLAEERARGTERVLLMRHDSEKNGLRAEVDKYKGQVEALELELAQRRRAAHKHDNDNMMLKAKLEVYESMFKEREQQNGGANQST